MQRYFGLWYEIQRDANFVFSYGEDCETMEYSGTDDGGLHVRNSQWNSLTSEREAIEGTAVCDGAKCEANFFSFAPLADYRVLDTDYTNYSVVYSCADLPSNQRLEDLWIISREQTLSQELIDAAHETIRTQVPNYDLDNNIYVTV
jgi:apolipoprotein D and lipocalin family protein